MPFLLSALDTSTDDSVSAQPHNLSNEISCDTADRNNWLLQQWPIINIQKHHVHYLGSVQPIIFFIVCTGYAWTHVSNKMSEKWNRSYHKLSNTVKALQVINILHNMLQKNCNYSTEMKRAKAHKSTDWHEPKNVNLASSLELISCYSFLLMFYQPTLQDHQQWDILKQRSQRKPLVIPAAVFLEARCPTWRQNNALNRHNQLHQHHRHLEIFSVPMNTGAFQKSLYYHYFHVIGVFWVKQDQLVSP